MDKFPPLIGIRCGNLQDLVADALPSTGEWHTLSSRVRKTEAGEFQIDELIVRRGHVEGVTFTSGAKYDGVLADPTAPYPKGDAEA